ncbi:DUF2059 domain-containing protein [Cohaesibacter gelatinilyticus]|uniref:DUF2059 domain-containing protein n=1 Tax=Cohaesibacter gelatinilyticus TaxID=372072 RepID=A0A285NCV6_9HYPH|nr:DUF2059 domain-containing protein [Cohaesibacter gelatinilyticus]SNZ07280.1 hypothetical protein SAMN06265368_0798 [Cohaesibacter gelatinilyticus]
MKSTLRATLVAGLVVIGAMAVGAQAQSATDGKKDTHLQAAIAVVEATNTLPKYEDQIDLIKKNAKVWLIRQNPALEKVISESVEKQAKVLSSNENLLLDNVATVWASYFSEEELKELQVFFKSEVGQKLGSYQARIIGESIGSVQKISQTLTAGLVNSVKEDLGKKGHKF